MKQESCSHNNIGMFNLFLLVCVCMMTKTVTAVDIRVGVILDMDDYIGEMGLNCITLALENFYAENSHYKTRLVLNVRNSKSDVVGAAAAGTYSIINLFPCVLWDCNNSRTPLENTHNES